MSLRLASIACVAWFGLSSSAQADDGTPAVIKTSLLFACHKHIVQADESKKLPQGGWTPQMQVRIAGPIAAGTSFYADVLLPGSKKPWVTINLGTNADGTNAGGWWGYSRDNLAMADDSMAVAATGDLSFVIRMANELTGKSGALYSGKFNVKKFKTSMPTMPKEYEWYVDQDWAMPIGYAGKAKSEKHRAEGNELFAFSYVETAVTLRICDSHHVDGFLYQNGKQLMKANARGQSPGWDISSAETSSFCWYQIGFGFTEADLATMAAGDYELRVTHSGALLATMKFSLDGKGNIVDPFPQAKLGDLDSRIVAPVKVTTKEAKIDTNAYKAGAYYGNAITGFAAPQ